MEHAPPPPYSETDIYSNSGRSPLSPNPNLSRSTSHRDDASQASTGNSVIYTPTESVNNDTYSSAAQLYFDSRPHPRQPPSQTLSHKITIGPTSTPDDLPYIPEFADLDVTTQDWATFINYVIPHHIDQSNGLVASEKMKAEVLDRRMQGLTISSECSPDLAAVDAQLNSLQPNKVELSGPQEDDVAAVVSEWNYGFFEPRGVRIMVTVIESDRPGVPPKDNAGRPAARAAPFRPGWQSAGSGPGVGSERERRGWGWGPQGAGHRGGRGGHGVHGGHSQYHGHGDRHGRHETNECRYARNRGFISADSSGFRVGRVMSAGEDGFRLGPMVADKSGFRIGNMLVANDNGFKLGGMTFGNTYHPDVQERGRDMKNGDDKKGRNRSRSISSHSSSSDDTVGTEDSEGSLPDYSDLKPNQLPVMKQSLMEWLNHPEQPVSKEDMKSLRNDIKLAKHARKPEGQELAQMKAELKMLSKAFKELRKNRAMKRKSIRKERRRQRKEQRHQAKQKRREEKDARKRERKGKGKATGTDYEEKATTRESDEYPPCETGTIHSAPPMPGFMGRPPMMPGMPGFPHGPRGMPGFPPGPRGMHMPSGFPVPGYHPLQTSFNPLGPGFNPFGQGTPRSSEEAASVRAKREHLEREANRILGDAESMHAEAEETRKRADEEEDEKSTLKLLDVAKELDAEVENLYEAADRLIAESVQLEEYLSELESGELPSKDEADKDYIKRMRQNGGVSI